MKLYPRTYTALKYAGHTPTKALEIIMDARRKNRLALSWCRICAAAYRHGKAMRKYGVLFSSAMKEASKTVGHDLH